MPFFLTFAGLVLIVTGIRNTYAALGAQLRTDFTGPGNFIDWLIAIGLVGAIGYVKEFRSFSHYFMALILIAMILAQSNSSGGGGFFQKLQEALHSNPVAPPVGGGTTNTPAQPQTPTNPASSIGGMANSVLSIPQMFQNDFGAFQ